MNQGLDFAHQMLAKHGEFLPFGVAMTVDGEVVLIGASTGEEPPPSRELLEVLLSGFKREATAGTYRAVAAFVDVLVRPPGETEKRDAIQVCLEHRDGFFADVFAPY